MTRRSRRFWMGITSKQRFEAMSRLIRKGLPGKAMDMFSKELFKPTAPPKKKRRFDMFGKKKYEELKKWFELALEQEAEYRRSDIDFLKSETDELKHINGINNFSSAVKELTDLKADVHELKYPMGEIELCDRSCYISGGMGIYKPTEFCYQYIFGNKKYIISEINRNITGYRKQGDFVQIRWEEIITEMNQAMVAVKDSETTVHLNTFLLKDELIPLPDCTVDFLSDFIEVK